MDTEFYTLLLSRADVLELQAALFQRVMLEDDVRREKGLEPVAGQPLLEKMNIMLGLSDSQIEKTERRLDEELWEHAWFAFTDEWAWFRAKQEVEKELGIRHEKIESARLKRLVELRYRRDFVKYVEEVEMKNVASIEKRLR